MEEFIDESLLEPLGLDDLSLLEGELDCELSVPLLGFDFSRSSNRARS